MLITSYATIYHAPEGVSARLWRHRSGLERVGTPRIALGSCGQRHSERCRQASDPPRHGSSRRPSSAGSGRPLELRSFALSDHVVPRRFTGLERDSGNIGRVDTAASQGQRRQGLGEEGLWQAAEEASRR